MSEGAAEGQQSQQSSKSEQSMPAQKQESVQGQDMGWAEHGELLTGERGEFSENVNQLTQNLAELANSGVNPEQGGAATREKLSRLKDFFKSDTGKNLAFLSGTAILSAAVGTAIIGTGFLPSLAIAGAVGGGIYLYDFLEKKVTQWRNQGHQESKPITDGKNQENKPK